MSLGCLAEGEDGLLCLPGEIEVVVVLTDLQQFLVGCQLFCRDLAVELAGLNGITGLVADVLCKVVDLIEKCHILFLLYTS